MKDRRFKVGFAVVISLLAIVLVVVSIVSSVLLVGKVKYIVRENTEAHVSETTMTKAALLDEKISFELASLKTLSQELVYAKNFEDSQKMAQAFKDNNGATTIWISGMKDDLWSSSGNRVSYPMQLKDELFSPALQGRSGMSDVFAGEQGKEQLMFYSPIVGQNGQQGAVYEAYPVLKLQETYGNSNFNSMGFSYVIDSDGEIIIKSNSDSSIQNDSNLASTLLDNNNSPEQIESFLEEIRRKNSGSAIFNLQGESQFFFFTPLKNQSDWNFLTVIPLKDLERNGNIIIDWTIILISIIVGVLFIVFMIVATISYILKKKDRENEKYIADLLDGLSENATLTNIFVYPESGRPAFVFKNSYKILGIPPEKLEVFDPEYKNPLYITLSDIIFHERPKDKTIWEFETIKEATGEKVWINLIGSSIMIGNREMYLFSVADVTADQKLREGLLASLSIAEDANASKSMFLSNMSHDIRTPMNAIIGFATLIEKDPGNIEKVTSYVKKITSSSKHLLGLINDILDMSRIESGKTTLNLSNENIASIIGDIDTIVRPQMTSKNQEFEVIANDIQHEDIVVDKLRLDQILINLLNNACKYTPTGGKITFEVRETEKKSRLFSHYQFIIKDNGYGMDADFVTNIFKPFAREENSVTNKVQGAGLGLAITKNLIDLMGGTIEVKSKKGSGSTFIVDLDFTISVDESYDNFFAENHISRVLVVDNDEIVCRSIKSNLEDHGVRVDYALSSENCLTYYTSPSFVKPDLILMDYKMPDVDGIETAKILRRQFDKTTPIIMLSNYEMANKDKELQKAKINAYMPKPFFLANFKKTIEAVIKNIKPEVEKPQVEVDSDTILQGKHILAAEDNEINAEILTEMLGEYDAEVIVCKNGEELFDHFMLSSNGDIDFILMDVQMPVMNGLEATKKIRESSHPSALSIPIIAMTANAFTEDVNACLEAGMNDHVAKPLDMNVLLTTVKRVLEKNGEEDEEE